jgi:molybdopterin converting factor subunit 1
MAMKIRLLLFAGIRDLVGDAVREIDVPDDATPGDVWSSLVAEHRALAAHQIPMVAVNEEYARPDTRLRENDELAFIPPVSGG